MVVVGGGGHGREAVMLAQASGRTVLGVLDDGEPPEGPLAALGQVLLGGVGWLDDHPDVQFVAALGYPAARRSVVDRARARGQQRQPSSTRQPSWDRTCRSATGC